MTDARSSSDRLHFLAASLTSCLLMKPFSPTAGPISSSGRQSPPMTDSNELQPSQKSLEDIEEIDTILQEFGKWLQKAKFEPMETGKQENCADPGLSAAAKRLLDPSVFKVAGPIDRVCTQANQR